MAGVSPVRCGTYASGRWKDITTVDDSRARRTVTERVPSKPWATEYTSGTLVRNSQTSATRSLYGVWRRAEARLPTGRLWGMYAVRVSEAAGSSQGLTVGLRVLARRQTATAPPAGRTHVQYT